MHQRVILRHLKYMFCLRYNCPIIYDPISVSHIHNIITLHQLGQAPVCIFVWIVNLDKLIEPSACENTTSLKCLPYDKCEYLFYLIGCLLLLLTILPQIYCPKQGYRREKINRVDTITWNPILAIDYRRAT